MVSVELTEDQIEYLLDTMESAYYWNTDNPTLDCEYNQSIIAALDKGLNVPKNVSKTKIGNRFENIF